jgi:D-serine dehydratase
MPAKKIDPLLELLGSPLQVHCRNLPLAQSDIRISDIPSYKWQALEGDLLYPLLLLKETALNHNIQLMRRYCAAHGVLHAPHAKTPMSPQLVWRLLNAGGWGTSVATIDQVRVMRRFGVRRLLMANQLLEPQALRWIAAELERDPTFEFWCLVDSERSVRLMDDALAQAPAKRKIQVLVELGVTGGRAGCRNLQELLSVARAVAGSKHLALTGVELYEAMAAGGANLDEKLRAVDHAMAFAREALQELLTRRLVTESTDIILTAGGSLYFDRVVSALTQPRAFPNDVKIVLRGGCVVTHESGANDRLSPLGGRNAHPERLQQALELWGMVLSRPEPELVIVNFGKRDAPYDKGMPLPFAKKRGNGVVERVGDEVSVLSLNDQHARVSVPEDCALDPGDLLGCHVAHPCTAFDKWRFVPVVDDNYGVTDGILTFF